MAEQITVVMDVIAKMDNAEAGFKKLQGTLQKFKLPDNLDSGFKKSFANIESLFAKYKSQLEKGFETKADVSSFVKTSKAIDAELDRLSKHFTELTGKEIDFRIKTDEVKRAEKDIADLALAKEKFGKDTLQLKVEGIKKDELSSVRKALEELQRLTKGNTGKAAGSILEGLDTGNIQQVKKGMDDLLRSFRNVKSEAKLTDIKKAFGLDITDVVTKIINTLRGVENEMDTFNQKTREASDNLQQVKGNQIAEAGEKLGEAANECERLRGETQKTTAATQEYARATQSMSQQLGDLQQTTQYFFSLRNMINLFKRGIDDAVQSVKELDKAMTETAVVTDFSVADMWKDLPKYTQIANDLGATTQGAYETMTLYYQQGLNQQQAFELGAETMKMARIAGLDYAETTDMMTAALRGFNMELDETSAKRINDVYSKIAAVTASDTEELGTAMQRTASIAHSAGMSFEGTTAFLAQAIETTREPAENLGTAMKTIVARFQEMKKNPLEITEVDGEEVSYNKVDEALQSIGVSLKDTNGQFRELDQVFLDISARWDSLSQTQQRYIATTAAGSRQQSRFIAMMDNYERTMQLMEAANNSAGASDEQFGKTMDSLESKLNKLHNAWQQFTMGIANNAMIKTAVDGLTGFLNITNKLIDKLSLGIGPLKSIISLFAAFTGLKAGGKLINSLIGGLGGLLDPQSSFTKGWLNSSKQNNVGVNNAQAQAISNPIVQAIHQLQSAITHAPVTTNNQTGIAGATNASSVLYKNVNSAIRQALNTDKLTGSGLMKHLEGLDKTSQRVTMANLTGTQRNLNQNLLGQYGSSIFKKSMPAIQTAFKRIDQKVADESISFTEGYAAKVSPKALLEHLDMNNADERALAQSISTGLNNARQQALEDAVKARGKQNNIDYSDPKLLAKAVKAFAGTDEGKKVASGAEEKFILDPKIIRTPMQQAMDDLGKFGSGLTGAGMAISTFGNALTATGIPGIQQLGSVLSTLGSGIMSLGTMLSGAVMAVTAFTEAAAESAAVQKMIGFIKNPVTIAVAAVAAALIGLAALIKLHNKKIKSEAEQVTTNYNEKSSKAKENINNLKQYREELAVLSKGVDEQGLNVNLDTTEYERYREIVNSIAEMNPQIIQGYNAQGDAIIDNNNALEETLKLQERINQQVTDEYTNSRSLDKLIKARDLDEAFYDPTSKKTGQDSDPARQAAQHLVNIFKKSHVQDEFLEQFGLSYDQLAKDENDAIARFISNHDAMMQSLQNRYRATGRELNQSLIDGFGNLSEAYEAQQEAIKPLYDNLLTFANSRQLTSGFSVEMTTAFNKGLKTIASSKNSKGKDMQDAAVKLSKLMKDVTGKGSEYETILKNITNQQKEWSHSLEDATYKDKIEDSVEDLHNLAEEQREVARTSEDLSEAERAASYAMADFLDNQAAKALAYTDKTIQDLSSTFNQFSDSVKDAAKAYEHFEERMEGVQNYDEGIKSYKQIYDKIFEETEDENGVKRQRLTEGIGQPEFWVAAESFFTSDWLSGKDVNDVVKKLKEIGPALQEGEAGAIAFADQLKKSLETDTNFKKIFGDYFSVNKDGSIQIAKDIPEELMHNLAYYWDVTDEVLIAQFDNLRQFVPEFTFSSSNEEIRNALAADSRTIKGPKEAGTDKNEALITTKDVLVDAFHESNVWNEKQISTRLGELAKEQQVYTLPELTTNKKTGELILNKDDRNFLKDTVHLDESNFIDTLAPLIPDQSTLETYASEFFQDNGAWWEKTGSALYDEWSANQAALTEDLVPEEGDELPSIASSVSNIEGMMTADLYRSGQMEDTSNLDQMHRAIFGNEGWDTSIQKLKHGADLDLTKEQFEQYYSDATAAVSALSKAEEDLNAGRLQAIQDYGAGSEQVKKYDEAIQQVQSDLEYAQGAVAEADQYKETKTWQYDDPSIQQHVNDVISAGWGQLLSGIPVETLATPEAQQAMATIASNAFSPDMMPTEELTNALSVLGLEWNQAALSGMEAWNTAETASTVSEKITEAGQMVTDGIQTGLQTGVDQKGEELKQTGEEAGSSMLNKVDTSWIANLASGIIQKYEESVNNNPINIPDVAPTVNKGAETVTGIAQQAVAATLTVDTSDSDAKLDATQQKTNEVANTINQGATFTIDVPGVDKLNQAATAASNLSKQGGNQTVGVKTSFDAGAVKSGVDAIKGMTAKVQVGANTKPALDTAESARRAIDNKSATINVSTSVKGQNVDIYVTKHVKEAYTGVNNKISYTHVPQAGSLARGTKKGKVGPRNQGGMTLTGEVGYEIAWLPSENRSVILGANGPQMVNLPKDATVYNHEQSKDIMKKRKGIPAGSMWGGGTLQTSTSGGYSGGGGRNSTTSKTVSKTANHVKKKANEAADAIKKVSVWWENIARKTEVAQRAQDKNQKAFEKYLKEMRSTLRITGESLESGGGGGDDYLESIGKTLGYYEAQLEKATTELANLTKLTNLNQKQMKDKYGEDGYESITEISYKNGKKNKTEMVDLAKYIKEEDGTYVIDQAALDAVSSKDQRKAIADAANKEINDRLSKKYKAEDEIQKAQEAIEKMGEELYETFFKWENELTKIWNITQKIEQTEARISQAKGYSDLLESQLSTGMATAGKEFASKTLAAFKTGLQQQMKQINLSMQSLNQKKIDLSNLLSLDDEKATLTSIQDKLINTLKDQDTITKLETELTNKQAVANKAAAEQKTLEDRLNAIDSEIATTEKKTKTGSKSSRRKAKTKLAELQAEKESLPTNLSNATAKAATAAADYEAAKKAYDEAKQTIALNDTERIGYEEYAKQLEQSIDTQAKAWKFMTVNQLADGTLDVNFNTETFEAEKLAGNISEEQGKAIQDYVKSIVDGSKELSQQYTDSISLMNDMYSSLGDLQEAWAGYADELWDISEAEQRKEVDNAKKLSDSITNTLKNLLDEVKHKLDERRKQEDNAKTEKDISQKQQRLAALRADTAGGHQVEIAQLEKEIADAQQSYERSLEDQLLDRLQQQADVAAQQRERQIELQEATITEINNAAQVNAWMDNPEAYKEEIYKAFCEANDYNKKPEALQAQLDNKFNTLFNGLLTNQQEQDAVRQGIEVLEGQTEEISDYMSELSLLPDAINQLASAVGQLDLTQSTQSITAPSGLKSEETTSAKIDAALESLKPSTTTTTTTAATEEPVGTGLVSSIAGDLKKGVKNVEGVKALQTALNALGFTNNKGKKLAVDGQFGTNTQQAVKKFQKKYGLSQDGVVGASTKAKFKTLGYKTGGLADYTGLAWLDGTPSKPELVLNATDTQNFLALRDVLSKVIGSTNSVTNSYGGNATYEININVDKLTNDYDVDRVAERVKKIIVKDSGYRNVTQVRNFR